MSLYDKFKSFEKKQEPIDKKKESKPLIDKDKKRRRTANHSKMQKMLSCEIPSRVPSEVNVSKFEEKT